MSQPPIEESKGFAKNVENVSKVGTLILVTLYVLGLLITNAHLMALGIADFSALQARFIMIGALFMLYTIVLLAFFPTLVVLPVFAYRRLFGHLTSSKDRTRIITTFFLLSPIWTWLVIELYGSVVGYMYPWGRPWEVTFTLNWRFYLKDVVTCARQLGDAFIHLKIIFAALGLTTAVPFVVLVLGAGSSGSTPSNNSPAALRRWKPLLFLLAFQNLKRWRHLVLLLAFPGLGMLIFGYAESVFPNLSYNLGGGQPHIIELHLKAADSLLLRKELPVLGRDSTASSNTTIPLALWFQDGSFFYVTPAKTRSSGGSTLTAIAQESIQAIRYLGGYVRVSSAGRIDSTYLTPVEK